MHNFKGEIYREDTEIHNTLTCQASRIKPYQEHTINHEKYKQHDLVSWASANQQNQDTRLKILREYLY